MKNQHSRFLFCRALFMFNPFRIQAEKYLINTAIIIALVYFFFMVSGCSYYRAVTRDNTGTDNAWTKTINKLYPEATYPRAQYPLTNLEKMFFLDYEFFLVDTEGIWQLSGAEERNDTIYAQAFLLPDPPVAITDIPQDGKSVRYYPKQDSILLKRILIYTEEVKFYGDGKVYFLVEKVTQIKTFKNHPAMKIGLTFLILGGVATIALIAISIATFMQMI